MKQGTMLMRAVVAAILMIGFAVPAVAQQSGLDQRVGRLEKEMRAVQRKVFPGGSQQFFEPEIGAPASPAPAPGVPASTPVADLTARVGSLEQELARLTGQIEQNSFKLRQMEEQLTRFRSDAEFRLNTLEGGAPPAAGAARAPSTAPEPEPRSTDDVPAGFTNPGAERRPGGPRYETPPPAEDAGAPAAAVTTRKPSGDAGEDTYLAAYDLWAAKRFGEAVTALRAVVSRYPKHKRASYAQNLLGRALLDDNQPARAAEAFYANYQKMPRGERAPDSLYFLGQALMSLKPPKPADACKVYAELLDVYGETMVQTLKERVARGQADAKCG